MIIVVRRLKVDTDTMTCFTAMYHHITDLVMLGNDTEFVFSEFGSRLLFL